MKCDQCGFECKETDKFCSSCGAPIESGTNKEENNSAIQINDNVGVQDSQVTENTQNDSNVQMNNTVSVVNDFEKIEVDHSYACAVNTLNNPPYTNQNVNSVQLPVQSQRNNNGLKVVFIVIGIFFIIGVGLGLGFLVFGNMRNTSKESDNKEKSKVEEVQKKKVIITFAGSSFEIPDDIKYDINNERLSLTSKNWSCTMSEYDLTYTQMSIYREEYKVALEENGLAVKNIDERVIGKNKYLLYELEMDNVIMGFKAYTTNTSLLFSIIRNDMSPLSDKDLEELDDILNSSTILATRSIGEEEMINNPYIDVADNININTLELQ